MPQGAPHSRALRRAFRPARAVILRWRWPALAFLGLVAFGLGCWGFALHFSEMGESRSIGDQIYLAAQLFTIESGSVSPPTPWPLDVARFLAAFVSLAVGLGALAVIFRDQFDRLRVRISGRSVVVLGLGSCGSLLARNFSRAGYRVTGVERSPTAAVDECRGDGVAVVVGDASDRALLRSVGLHRADLVLVVCGDEGTNVEVAVRVAEQLRRESARRWRQRRSKTAVRCFVHIEDEELCALLRDSPVMAPSSGQVLELEFFNPSELAAPAMLDEHDVLDSGASHRLLVGLGQMGRQVALLIARAWWFRHREPLRITIVDHEVEARWARLQALEPALEAHCTIDRVACDITAPEFLAGQFPAQCGAGYASSVSAAYVCLDTDARALMASLAIRNRLHDVRNPAPVVVRMFGSAGLASMLDPSSEIAASGLRLCALADWSCRPEILLERDTERLARALHADYCRERAREGRTVETNPAMRPWDELGREDRESNRDQARDVDRKLWAVGCVRRSLADFAGEVAHFDNDETELLGRMEHDRWWQFKRTWGYRYGEQRSNKRHPDMVPWDDLDDEIREYDRLFVRDLPLFLLRTGYLVERLAALLDRSITLIEAGASADSAAPDDRDGRGGAYLAALAETGWQVRLAGTAPRRPIVAFTADEVDRVVAADTGARLRAETVAALPATLAGIGVAIVPA